MAKKNEKEIKGEALAAVKVAEKVVKRYWEKYGETADAGVIKLNIEYLKKALARQKRPRTPANLELEFELYEAPEPFFTVRALVLPEDPIDQIRYAVPDNRDELYDAEGFKERLKKVKSPRAPFFRFLVIKEGQRRHVIVPLPKWSVSLGYTIRTVRLTGTLKL